MKHAKLLKTFFATLLMATPLLLASAYVIPTNFVGAQSALDPICDNYPDDDTAPDVCKDSSDTQGETVQDNSVLSLLIDVIDIMLIGIGIVAVVMLIVASVKYITSTGDPAKTASARNTIIYAIAGVVVAVLGRAIVLFVLGEL